jgi:polysaccharide export outer membrane protein
MKIKSGRLGVITLALAVWAVPASAEALLDTGDVLELFIAGPQPLAQRASINRNGDISFAKIGILRASGSTLTDLRARVNEQLASRVFYVRSLNGQDRPTTIDLGDVSLAVVEYRPVYINGDVSKPGDQPFRAGMSVRQAIALAGGLDIARFRVRDPFLDAAEARAEYETLWTEYAGGLARKLRLEAMLDDQQSIKKDALNRTPLAAAAIEELLALEGRRLASDRSDIANEKRYLKQSLNQLDMQVTALKEQQEQEKQGLVADQVDAESTRALLSRGITSATRTTEARRALLLSSTRLLQTGAQLSTTLQQREEVQRKLEKVDDHRRIDLMGELQSTQVLLQTLEAKIRGAGEKLLYSGAMKSQLARGSGGKPEIVVFRRSNSPSEKGAIRIDADQDQELSPGDVVEVSLKIERPASAFARSDVLRLAP